jgi:MoxR-like ATPase
MDNTKISIDNFFKKEGFSSISHDEASVPLSSSKHEYRKSELTEKEPADRIKYIDKHKRDEDKTLDYQTAKDIHRSSIDTYDIPVIIEYLLWHMNRISLNVIDREEIIKQAFFAILTGEHVLLLSKTGMAKSFLANSIFNTFSGARIFSAQASKDQTPDNYFGPYNIEEFKKGRIKHNVMGSIIEAKLVFLDEFFDASDVVLRSLLSVLNERKFINGQEQIDAAIHTAIATANYMRMNEVTEAVLDRFTYKAIIPENSNTYSQLLIDKTYSVTMGNPEFFDKKIHFDQIIYLNDIIKNKNKDLKIEIPDTVYFMKNIIVNRFVGEMKKYEPKFFISPRKLAKLSDFIRANALLSNRLEAQLEDIADMHLALCTLNRYVSVKTKDKSERDLYLDVYRQTMTHFNVTGGLQQIEFLLNVRNVLFEMRKNPANKESLLKRKGLLDNILGMILKIFPNRNERNKEELTPELLKKSVFELEPVVSEVSELKDGILKEFKDL